MFKHFNTMQYDNTGNGKSAFRGDEDVNMETEERNSTQESSSADSNEEKKEGEGTHTNQTAAATQVTQTIRIPTKTRDGDSRRSTEFYPDTFLGLEEAENQTQI